MVFRTAGWFLMIGLVWAQGLLAEDGMSLSRATLAARVAEIEKANDLSVYRDDAQWSEDQSRLREQLIEMLGLPSLENRDPDLRVVVTGSLETDRIVVKKLHFQSLPGLYVTANLYCPRQLDAPAPAVLYVCGHGQVLQNGISLGNKTHYQHHPAWFAEHGYVCLTIDTVQLGEIEGIHHGLYSYGRWDWPSRGYTPAGVEAWNAIRAIDYLVSRPDVDASRIGITGRSGGGAYSWYAAAIDPRISVAVPVAGITDLRDHVVGQCVRGHCDCMYMVNRYGWDYSMLAAMVFPRALLIGNTDKDPIFPLDGVERVHYQVRHVYHHGYKENLGIQWTTGGHDDTQDLQIGCFVWFDHFLRGQRRVITDPAEARFERSQLRVLRSIPDDQRVTDVQDWFVPTASRTLPQTAEQWESMCREWTDEISGSVRGRIPLGDLERVRPGTPQAADRVAPIFQIEAWGRNISCFDLELPPASKVRVVHFAKNIDSKPETLRIVPANQSKWDWIDAMHRAALAKGSESASTMTAEDAGLSDRDEEVAWVFPEGRGPWAWHDDTQTRDALHLKRSYLLCGWSLEGRQIAGIVRAMEFLAQRYPDASLEVAGDTETEMHALHAAMLSPKPLRRVTIGMLPESYGDGFVIPGILRKCDIPQTVAAVGSRHPLQIDRRSQLDWSYIEAVESKLSRRLIVSPP